MKNQFFGDINDYYKYGLLRILAGNGEMKIGVCWMLTRDKGRQYLDDPDRWARYDGELFTQMRILAKPDGQTNVERAESLSILPSASFYREQVPNHREERKSYFEKMRQQFKEDGVGLIFLDPDTGLATKKLARGRSLSAKHLYPSELCDCFRSMPGCSVLVYQHLPRKPREKFIAGVVTDIRKWIKASEVLRFSTSQVVFFLVAQRKHVDYFRRKSEEIGKVWQGTIKVSPPEL